MEQRVSYDINQLRKIEAVLKDGSDSTQKEEVNVFLGKKEPINFSDSIKGFLENEFNMKLETKSIENSYYYFSMNPGQSDENTIRVQVFGKNKTNFEVQYNDGGVWEGAQTFRKSDLNRFIKDRNQVNKTVLIPLTLHDQIKRSTSLDINHESSQFTKDMVKQTRKNVQAIIKIEELSLDPNKSNSLKAIQELQTDSFKDLVKLQKNMVLVNESMGLVNKRDQFQTKLNEEKNNKNLLGKTKDKKQLDSLNGKVDEINISIQCRTTAIGVKELTNKHQNHLKSVIDSTKEIYDLINKTVQSFSHNQSENMIENKKPILIQGRNVQMER